MQQLVEKIKKIKTYINDIISIIKKYNPNTKCTSPKKLKYVAEEMENIILENSQIEVNYMRDVVGSQFYIAMQVPIYFRKESIEFEVDTNDRASISVSGAGTDIFDNGLSGIRKINIPIPNTKVNCEGWKPSNIVIRSNSNFTKFNSKNQNNIIAIQGNMIGIENLNSAFIANRNLRVIDLRNIESTNNADMLAECNNLINATLSFKENVKYDATEMFYACDNMRYLKLDFSNISIATDMLAECYSLEKIEIPKDSTIPNKLNLTDTAIQPKELIEFINNLKKIDEEQIIYVNEKLYNSFSTVQLNSFKSKGYKIDIFKDFGDE